MIQVPEGRLRIGKAVGNAQAERKLSTATAWLRVSATRTIDALRAFAP
jgi:hypothetical protein